MVRDDADDESIAAVSRTLYRQGMTDGLPVIPPTEARVAEMLRGTDTPDDAVIGRLGNDDNPITVAGLASNAVMAGCLPTHMPVLEAGVRALADPDSNSIQFSVSTGGWAYQWIVNGPVRGDVGIAGGTGAYGPNYRANRAIARALGIAYRNTAKIHPGEKDMGVMGNPFKFSLLLGEHEEASPWEPYHVTAGYDEGDSTISLSGPNSFVQWEPAAAEAEAVLRGMLANTPPAMVGGEQQGGDFDQTITYVLCPASIDLLADAGLSKRDVKRYVADNSAIPVDEFQKGVLWEGALEGYHGRVENAQVPQIRGPEYVRVVAGGGRTGRCDAVIGPSIGGPVTEPIDYPDGWSALVAEYGPTE
ncbi:hypothetical protein J2754_000285 [Halarchaeum solikamskense]|uniref:hypothetical protein n=1 Tax=Halarchaeum nitratireducens TaxID=489913 RepID=UPI001B3A903A|nr:hypothetical protein [Halarchaeum solikamskense]MBP2249988.1 hypothetical protein [Halarchaeum solikamskense]